MPPPPGTRVHVVGLGRSGVGAALLAVRLGCRVSATDLKARGAIPDAPRLEAAGVTLDLGGHDPAFFSQAGMVVVSPGVPGCPHLDAAAGADVISEIELAYRCSRADLAGITGSNGKSTVTTMLGAIMAASRRPSWTGGNLGTPLSDAVGGPADVDGGLFVVELSSFQLELVRSMRCALAAILNVTPDHMDRYASFAEYAGAKGRIFMNQGAGDHAVVVAGEREAVALTRGLASSVHIVGGPGCEVREEGGRILVEGLAGVSCGFDCAALGLSDGLAVRNALVAIAMALLAGARSEDVEAGMRSFRPLPHRCELVADRRGVRWVDDSKATNPASVIAALEGSRGPVILIAGGYDKKLDYGSIAAAARGRVRTLLLIGQAADAIEEALRGVVSIEKPGTLERAVERASAIAVDGDTVLLSPACASFDQFRNYEHRGEEFRRLVLAL